MKNNSQNITPIFSEMLSRSKKEELLKQHGVCLWFTGLSGSGKSTLAVKLEKKLHNAGYLVKLLDGDNVRSGINSNLGFSETDRIENIRRIAEINKLFIDTGVITICSFISPTNDIRLLAEKIIGKNDFYLIYINATLQTCENRDVKGLYKKARKGEIANFTGISAPFEIPNKCFLEINTTKNTIEECVNQLYNNVLPTIKYRNEKF